MKIRHRMIVLDAADIGAVSAFWGVVASELTEFRRRIDLATFGEPPDPPATTAFITALRTTINALG
jgi:hypothetical protein